MKKRYYFFTIVFCLNAFGQNLIPNYQIGNFIDYNKKRIDGYYDFDYEPKNSLKVSYKCSDNFTKGFYINADGLKVNGLLKYSDKNRELKFKLFEKDDVKSINAYETQGYVIGIDTFSVVKNVMLNGILGGRLSEKSEFAENIESIGGMKFYKFTGLKNGNSYIKYLVKQSDTSDFLTFPSGKDKFRNFVGEIFKNDSTLRDYIENGKYDDQDIPSILKIYKYKRLFNLGQNIYYNSSNDEINNKTESMYYSKIESVKDSVFHLNNFFSNNQKIYEGDFTSFYPHNKQGNFLFYFPNGQVRRQLNFKNNKPKDAIDYFENGKTHRVYKVLGHETIIYQKVYNTDNVDILDKDGNGNELFEDRISGKKIYYEYESKRLKSAYFIDKNGVKIYQLCKNNAELKNLDILQKEAKANFKYPLESLENNRHGFVLVKCLVEPSGLVSELNIIKGLDVAIDKATLDFLSCFKTEGIWIPGKVDGKRVKQEIIFPIEFSIETSSFYRNNYNNFMFHNNFMMMQNLMQQNMIRVGGFR